MVASRASNRLRAVTWRMSVTTCRIWCDDWSSDAMVDDARSTITSSVAGPWGFGGRSVGGLVPVLVARIVAVGTVVDMTSAPVASTDPGVPAGPLAGADTLVSLTAAAAAISVPVLSVDMGGVVVAANDAVCRFFGRERDDVVGRHLMELAPEEDRQHAAAVHGSDGDQVGWVVTLVDASAIEQAAAALDSADHRQVAVLERLPTPVMVAVDGVVVFANPAAFDLVGVADIERLSMRIAAGVHVDDHDRDRFAARVAASQDGGTPGPATFRVLRPDRTARLVEWTMIPMELGGRPALLWALVDQTELLQARDTVASSEAHQRQIVDSLAEGVLVVDASGICTDANQAAVELLWLPTVDFLVGSRLDDLRLVDRDGAPLAHHAHPLWRALFDAEPVHAEVHRLRVGDEHRSLRMSVHPVLTFGQTDPTSAVVTFTDVTEELANVEAVAASEARFRDLAAFAPVAILEADASGRWTYANRRWTEFTGLELVDLGDLCDPGVEAPGAAPEDGWLVTVHPDDRDEVAEAWRASRTGGFAFVREVRHCRPDGRIVPVQMEVTPLRSDDGVITGWLGTATDLTEQFALRRELEAREVRFRQLAERSPDVIMRIALDSFRFDYVSPAVEPLLGATPDELYLDPLLFVRRIHPEDAPLVLGLTLRGDPPELIQFRLVHADGSVRTVEVRSNLVRDGDGVPTVLEATARDVTAAADLHRHLDTLAHRDTLTGLLNRRALLGALEARLAAGAPTAVLFCDLDGFKAVNDSRGHEAGDEVLVEVGRRFAASVRDGDLVARLAGDEFVVVSRPEGANRIADRLLQRITEPIVLSDGATASVGTSIGIADVVDPATDPVSADDLLKQADLAMYSSKRTGKGRVTRA